MAFVSSLPIAFPSNRLRNCSRRAPARQPARSRRVQPPTATFERGAQVDETDVEGRNDSREARMLLWKEVEDLKTSLDIAVRAERFADAARIRDKIESLSLADDYFRTQTELKKAVEEQRFADAAKLRDVLNALEPPPAASALRAEQPAVKKDTAATSLSKVNPDDVQTWSETVTSDIQVRVESYYMPEQSVPEHDRYLFGYKVTIVNKSSETCQLVSRHWTIENFAAPASEVKGPGVVGRQPVLEPGESFEYTSACPITVSLAAGQSVVGSMKGSYEFCKGSTGSIKFQVAIDQFYFKLPFRNYRLPNESSLWPKS